MKFQKHTNRILMFQDRGKHNSQYHFVSDNSKLQFFELWFFNNICVTLNRGPYYLGVYDLANIKDSGALFIRKVAKEIDPNLFHLFPVSSKDEIPYIHWPNELKISPKIDWDKTLKQKEKKQQSQ